MYRLKHNIQIKPKKIIGYIVLLNVMPFLGMLITWTDEGLLVGYGKGWIINISILIIIYLSLFLIWCFND